MSVRENTPTFKYVTVENLVITYNQKPYPIKNMYTNKKYIIWNIDRPNQLEDSNIRPEESLLEYLIVINDNGIPTILSHDNLTLSFDSATNGFDSNSEFDSIKEQVNENTKKYNILIKDVDGITNVIGKTEELKDGSIIYNLNKIKADSESFGVQLEEVKTQVDDKFKDLKPVILNNLIDYSISVSEYKLSLTSLKNDIEVTEEELSKINTNKTNMSNSLTKVLTSLDSLKSILDSVNDKTKSQLITDAKNQLTLLNNSLISDCDTALLDNKLSDYEKTTITQKAYELSQYIGVVQNTCNNITVGGSDGVIYKVQNDFIMYKDKTENNITELNRNNNDLFEKYTSVKQTTELISQEVGGLKTSVGDWTNTETISEGFSNVTKTMESISQEVKRNSKIGSFRYIRDYLKGSTVDSEAHYVELQVFKDDINVAAGKTVTSSGTGINLEYVTNGDITSSQYAEITDGQLVTEDDLNGYKYIQVDLGSVVNNIEKIKVWHYYSDSRAYYHKLEVSKDGNEWFRIFDSDKNGAYNESPKGKTYIIDDTYSETKLEQTADKFNWLVKSGSSSSSLTLTDSTIEAIAKSNIKLKSNQITIEGYTTVNDNIVFNTNGTLTAKNANISGKILVGEGSSIDGKYIQTNTVLAEKIAIGDFTNYVVLEPNATFLGTSGFTEGYEICSIAGSEKNNHANLSNKLYGINGGDKFRVKAMIKSDTVGSRLDITCCWRNANNEIVSSNSIYTVVAGANTWTEINEIITVPSRPSGASYVRFKINIQAEQYRRIYVERLNITRMYSGDLIVDGSINAIKLSADAIDGKQIKGVTIVGGEIRGSSNFFTAPDVGSVDGYAFRIYSSGELHSNNFLLTSKGDNYSRLEPNGNISCSKQVNSPAIVTGNQSLWLGIRGVTPGSESNFNLEFTQQADNNCYLRPGYNGQTTLGHPAKMFNNVFSVNGTSSSSDRTLKENIRYLSASANPNCATSSDITEEDLYNFVKDDLITATFNFIGNKDKHIGFIAQDLLYNADGSDSKVGQFIVNKPDDERSPLTYNEKIYTNVLAGALRHAILKFEERFNSIENKLGGI